MRIPGRRPARSLGGLLSIGVLVVVVACTRPPVGPPLPTTTAPPAPRTNVVRIITDDQDVSSQWVMAKTQQLLTAKGVQFTDSTVSLSLCCPSRVTHLTGQYAHNHNVWDVAGPVGGYANFAQPENSLAPWLKAGGYTTAHVGKYLNGYNPAAAAQVPPGWDDWFAMVEPPSGTYPYYGYTVSDNGTSRTYGTADEDYVTNVLSDRAVNQLRSMEASGKPFFLDYWPTAPHYGPGRDTTTHFGPVAAPAYEQANPGAQAPRTANYRPAVNGIPQGLQDLGAYLESVTGTPDFEQNLDGSYRDALNSLLSVDDSIERLVNELQASGQLDHTLIIFTSDNGMMWGNHGLTLMKWEPYEESLRVPLVMRGPGIPQGVTSDRPVSNIDIVPTILQATGVTAGRTVDGKALLPYPTNPSTDADRALLVESNRPDATTTYQFGAPFNVPRFQAVRTSGFQYTEWVDGFVELFDLQLDPAEMHNLANDPNYAGNRARLSAAIAQLGSCAGAACDVMVPGLTHPGPSSGAAVNAPGPRSGPRPSPAPTPAAGDELVRSLLRS